MFTTLFTVAAFALSALAADLSINTPKAVTTCQEVTVTWQGGKAPYTVSVVPGDDPCDDALVTLPSTNDTWFKWQNPSLQPGTKVIFAIEDATEDEAWSAELTIQAGSTTSCPSPSSSASSSDSAAGTGTTLVVPAQATQTVGSTDDSPVVNGGATPGGSLGAAGPSMKGGAVAVSVGLVLASLSIVL